MKCPRPMKIPSALTVRLKISVYQVEFKTFWKCQMEESSAYKPMLSYRVEIQCLLDIDFVIFKYFLPLQISNKNHIIILTRPPRTDFVHLSGRPHFNIGPSSESVREVDRPLSTTCNKLSWSVEENLSTHSPKNNHLDPVSESIRTVGT